MLSRADLVSCRTISEEPNVAQISLGTKGGLDALWRVTSNAKEPITRLRKAWSRIYTTQSRTALPSVIFFFTVVSDPNTFDGKCNDVAHDAHVIFSSDKYLEMDPLVK
jgi:hypothetical protein